MAGSDLGNEKKTLGADRRLNTPIHNRVSVDSSNLAGRGWEANDIQGQAGLMLNLGRTPICRLHDTRIDGHPRIPVFNTLG